MLPYQHSLISLVAHFIAVPFWEKNPNISKHQPPRHPPAHTPYPINPRREERHQTSQQISLRKKATFRKLSYFQVIYIYITSCPPLVLITLHFHYHNRLRLGDSWVVINTGGYPASKVTSLRRRIDDEIGHGDVT